MKRNLLILVIILSIGFIVNSCGDEDTTKQTYIVTFNSNGGTIVTSQTVIEGNKIEKPITVKLGYAFVNWYSNIELSIIYDFNDEIKSNIILYAKWQFDNSLSIGDNGPSGGIIFYVANEEGFIMTDNNSVYYYLEAAPNDINTTLAWASLDFESIKIDEISELDWQIVGNGIKNTNTILQIDNAAPAALACINYSITLNEMIYNDWFLPSFGEFSIIKNNLNNLNGNFKNERYWTSSQSSFGLDTIFGLVISFSIGDAIAALPKGEKLYVRPIRAF